MASLINRFRRWVGNHINGLNKVQQSKLQLVKLEDMLNVLIIAETNTPEQETAMDAHRREISKLCPKATVKVISFYRKGYQTPAHISAGNVLYVCQEDFSFFYGFESEEMKNILANDYDALFVSSISANPDISYVLPYVRAVLKIGHQSLYGPLVNIMINSNAKSIESYNKDALSNVKMIFGHSNNN